VPTFLALLSTCVSISPTQPPPPPPPPPAFHDFTNPAAASAAMAALRTALSDSVLTSFTTLAPVLSVLGDQVHYPSAPSGARACTPPISPGVISASSLPSTALAAALPDSDFRRVFAYDTSSRRYQRTADSSGPDSGVRFLLYAVDTLVRLPLRPLVVNGAMDLIDRTTSLEGIVTGQGPSLISYAMTPQGTQSSYRQFLTGTVTSGGRVYTFRDSTTRLNSQLTVTAIVDDSAAGTHLSLSVVRVILDQFDYYYSLDFSFSHDTETVRLQGNNDAYCQLTSIGVTVTVNGGSFATVTNGSSANSPAIARVDSQPLSPAQDAAIRDLIRGQRSLFTLIEAMSSPGALALPP